MDDLPSFLRLYKWRGTEMTINKIFYNFYFLIGFTSKFWNTWLYISLHNTNKRRRETVSFSSFFGLFGFRIEGLFSGKNRFCLSISKIRRKPSRLLINSDDFFSLKICNLGGFSRGLTFLQILKITIELGDKRPKFW